jgi:hydroxymethylglutaryl-CoA synthase
MLVENNPKMLRFELDMSGSASDYRGPDFRKPFSRFTNQTLEKHGQPRDFPVFNGKYSTTCYVDEVLAAMKDLFRKVKAAPSAFMKDLGAVFLHRPFLRMAETGLIMSLLYSFALGDDLDQSLLDEYARLAGVDGRALRNELLETKNVYELVEDQTLAVELFPLATATAKAFRKTEDFEQLVVKKLRLGGEQMAEVGNLYTASLPVWLAAGLEQAVNEDLQLDNSRFLTIGYGSGDAAEVIPMRVVAGWQSAAERIQFSQSLATATDLDQSAYETLHDTGELSFEPTATQDAFYIASIGARDRHFDDSGIEYYKYRKNT